MATEFNVTFEQSEEINVTFKDVVMSPPVLETKNITVTENGQQTIIFDEGYDGLEKVNVTTNVPNPSTGSLSISLNGTYDVTDKASAVVNVISIPKVGSPVYTGCTIEPNRGTDEFVVDCSLAAETHSYTGSTNITFDKCFCNALNKLGTTIKTITILGAAKPISMPLAFGTEYFYAGSGQTSVTKTVETINAVDMDFSEVNSCVNLFRNCIALKIINATFDGTGWNTYAGGYNQRWSFYNCTSLQEIRFKPNTIPFDGYHIFNVSQVFSDATIISIANGLKEGVTEDNALQLMSTPKSRCSEILGTVSLDSTGAYHIFTQSSSGTTTLTDFITNTKGWTLA